MWQTLDKYHHTLRHLRPRQLYYRLYYLLRNRYRRLTGYRLPLPQRTPVAFGGVLIPSVSARGLYPCHNQFRFLNQTHTFSGPIDWNHAGYGKLWTYNLNYFEYLIQEDMPREEGLRLIRDFIETTNARDTAYEPFPTSLRCLFWIRFLLRNGIAEAGIHRHLYGQLRHLSRYREYHLLGNHLLENGFALLAGACYFRDEGLLSVGAPILQAELREQILPDGGHFERSPMYHQLMLYRLLDVINLASAAGFGAQLLPLLRRKAKQMMGWLQSITFRNGDLPLLNDSAFGIAPTTAELLAYARRLGVEPAPVTLKETGYRKIEKAAYELVVDAAPVGPDYIPGHAHSDTLSFVLYVQEQPFLVDTGTSTYEKNNRRQRERSTAAHNTVQLAGSEQTEVWGGFRVARRAYPRLHEEQAGDRLTASHDGYHKLGVGHRRRFTFGEQMITIEDKMVGSPGLPRRAHFHFHPGISPRREGNRLLTGPATLLFTGADQIELCDYEYAPEFNRRLPARKAIVTFGDYLKTRIELVVRQA